MPTPSKVLPLPPPSALEQPLMSVVKGSIEHRALLLSDLALRILREQAPAVIKELSLSYRGTPLHTAAYRGDMGMVEALLSRGANPSSTSHSHGMQPLHLAALRGNVSVVRRLLEAGAPALVDVPED